MWDDMEDPSTLQSIDHRTITRTSQRKGTPFTVTDPGWYESQSHRRDFHILMTWERVLFQFGFLLLWRDTMTTTTLIKENI